MASRILPISLIAVLALGYAAAAKADPSAADKETARSLMANGRAERSRGDLAAARKAFAAAEALMHVPTTGLELAQTEAAMGLLVEARDTSLQILRQSQKPDDPPAFAKARTAATALGEELEHRIPSMIVTVEGAPAGSTARLTLDGIPLPPEIVGEPYKLDPGHHVIVAMAGTAAQQAETVMAEGEVYRLTIELPDQAAPPPAPPDVERAMGRGLSPYRSTLSRAMIYSGFGFAGAAAVAGSITGALSWTKARAIRASGACAGDQCGPAVHDDLAFANSLAALSNASFIAAAVGVVVGVVGVLTPGAPRPIPSPAAAGGPGGAGLWIAPDAVGVCGQF